MLAGSSAQIKRDRDLHPDASEIGMIEETRQQIEQKLGVDRVGALMRQGAAMAVEHVLRLAWRTWKGQASPCRRETNRRLQARSNRHIGGPGARSTTRTTCSWRDSQLPSLTGKRRRNAGPKPARPTRGISA